MGTKSDLDAFLRPRSVAVIGATERPGAWGSFIMSGLLSLSYPGKIYPVNRQADQVFGIPAGKDIGEIEGPVLVGVAQLVNREKTLDKIDPLKMLVEVIE